jgi:putative ubiquitin-RnfH superfamily antitoxin RatB of RatAB toxin-antitoxin module
MRVEVVYAASADEQYSVTVELAAGATVRHAITASGVLARFPLIDSTTQGIGIFGEPVALDDALQDGDRVELYRPLIADPKEARRARAGSRGPTK